MTKSLSHTLLLFILFLALISRLINLENPPSYYFDEVYHAVTAKAYAKNDPAGYEWWHPPPEPGTAYEWLHPPIAKLLMAGGILLFGEHALGWRLPGVFVGLLVIFLTYLLAFRLTKKYSIALLSALLASLDGLLLSQSRIGMNDIYVTAAMLATIITYHTWLTTKKSGYLLATGILAGVSLSTKWSGLFVLPIIGLTEGWLLAAKKVKFKLTRYFKLAIALVIIPPLIYVLSYAQFFLQGHTIDQFIELHRQITWYQFNLDATHSYQSKAWQWPLLLKPVWQHVDYSKEGKVGNIYAMGNPFISWFGLLAVIWLSYQIITRKKFRSTEFWLLNASFWLVWAPWLLSPRIMFYYHYTPAIPFLTIILAIALQRLYHHSNSGKYTASLALGLIFLGFLLFYPHWVGLPIPRAYSDWLFWLPSWR